MVPGTQSDAGVVALMCARNGAQNYTNFYPLQLIVDFFCHKFIKINEFMCSPL